MIALAIAALDIARWCLLFQPMPSLAAKVRQRDRGGLANAC